MLLASDDEGVQNFMLDGLDHPFDVCPQVRGTRRHLRDLNSHLAVDLIEGGRVLHVVVSQQDRQREIGKFGMLLELLRLLRDPSRIRLASGGGEPESAGADVDEGQYVEGGESSRCPYRLREEVALDQCGGVDADEFGPRAAGAIGGGGDVVFFEDGFYGGAGD